VAERPKTGAGADEIISMPDGYPSVIGRALSPQIGKWFNDCYTARATGSGASVKRTISTVPTDGVVAKNSTFLKREYETPTALAEIFAAMKGEAVDPEFIAHMRSFKSPA
jgi:hypothetical protein